MKRKMLFSALALALFIGGNLASGTLMKVGAKAVPAPQCNCELFNPAGIGVKEDNDCKEVRCWLGVE